MITSKLNHPNVVKSLEFFDEFKGEIHQVMEYIEGVEVFDNIAEQPNHHYTEEYAKKLFKQVL